MQQIPRENACEDPSTDLELDLQTIFMAIWRRLSLCIFIVGTAILVALAYVFSVTPTYMANSKLLAQRGQLRISQVQSVEQVQVQGSDKSFMTTQVEILSSTPLMQAILNEFFKGDERYAKALDPVDALRKSFKIKQVPNTELIDVGFVDENPERAAKVVNRLGQLFIDSSKVRTSQLTKSALGRMEQELAKKGQEVEGLRKAIEEFNKNNNMYSVDVTRAQVEKRLGRIRSEVDAAEVRIHKLKEAAFFLTQWKAKNYDMWLMPNVSVRGRTQRALVQLREEMFSSLKQLETLKLRMNENHITVRNLRKKIEDIRQEAKIQSKLLEQSVQTDLDDEKQFLNELLKKQSTLEAEVLHLNDLAHEHGIMKSKLSAAKANYGSVLSRFAELKVAYATDNTTNGIFQVISPASVPELRYFPKRGKILVITTLGAGFLSVLLCIVLELMNASVKSPTGLRKFSERDVFDAGVGGREMKADTVARLMKTSPAPASLLFTTAREEAGSDLFAQGLCEKISKLGARVLLVDADFQKRGLSQKLNYQEKSDLLTLLAGGKAKATVVPLGATGVNFLGLTRGLAEEDEWNIKNIAAVVQGAGSGYDYVVVYAPNLLACPESRLVAMQFASAQCLLYVQQRATRQGDLASAFHLLNEGQKVSFVYASEDAPKTFQDRLRRIL